MYGQVYDVVVDLRKGPPTFVSWVGVTLCDETLQALYIPSGFAYGFCVLSSYAIFIYRVSAEYRPDLERGLRWNDEIPDISWPIKHPIVSQKDQHWPSFHNIENRFTH